MLSNYALIGGSAKRRRLTLMCQIPDIAFYPVDVSTFEEASLNQEDRMRETMDMQGLLAVLEEDEADLMGRKETRFSPVPLTGVQIEVWQQSGTFLQIILR